MSVAKSQIDYKALHNDYLTVRNNTILNVIMEIYLVLNQRTSFPQKSFIWESSKYFKTSRNNGKYESEQNHQWSYELNYGLSWQSIRTKQRTNLKLNVQTRLRRYCQWKNGLFKRSNFTLHCQNHPKNCG